MKSWILITLLGVLPPAALAIAFGGAAPPGGPTALPRERASVVKAHAAIPSTAPPTDVEEPGCAATPLEAAPPPVSPATRVDRLVTSLRRACRDKNESEIARAIAALRVLLATSDPSVDSAVVDAAVAGGTVGTRLAFMIHTYPDMKRRVPLRTLLMQASAPRPEGAPAKDDRPAIAAYINGPASAADRLWILRRLDADAMSDPRVLASVADLVLRSQDGGALATAALGALSRGPREQAETLALEILARSSDTAVLRCAVRLLGSTASSTGIPHLLKIARDDADTTSRRLAAFGLVGKSLGPDGVDILGAIAESAHEDMLVRRHAKRALESEVLRQGPDAALACEILKRIHTETGCASSRSTGMDACLADEAARTTPDGSPR